MDGNQQKHGSILMFPIQKKKIKACYHCISSHHSSLRLRAGPRWQATYCCSSETWGGWTWMDLTLDDLRSEQGWNMVLWPAKYMVFHMVVEPEKKYGETSWFKLQWICRSRVRTLPHGWLPPCELLKIQLYKLIPVNFARRTSQRCCHRYPSVIMTRTWLRWRLVLAWGVIDQVRCGQMTGLRLMMMVDDGYLGVHDG